MCPVLELVVSHTLSKISPVPRAVRDSDSRLRPWPLGATAEGGAGGHRQGLLVVKIVSPWEGAGPVKIRRGRVTGGREPAGVKI